MTQAPAPARTGRRWALLAVGALAAVALGAGGVLLVTSVASDEKTDLAADAEATAEDLAGARTALEARFPNAQSVTFGKVGLHGDGETRAVCGYVDVQQPDDGMDGEERFVFVDGELTLADTDGDDAVTAKWRDVCEG